jgi:hypothetical protein
VLGPPTPLDPGYLQGLIGRALATADAATDPAAAAGALRRVSKFLQALLGWRDGSLQPGSRQPIPGAPAWATPEVVRGGFATGALAAGGPLLDHELALLAALGIPGGGRAEIHAHYLAPVGLRELQQRLQSGCYRVGVAEEAALLVVCWLLQRAEADRARRLLDLLAPWLAQLRFHPLPTSTAQPDGTTMRRRTLRQGIADLTTRRSPQPLLRELETLTVWAPFEDRVVQCIAATLSGPWPQVIVDAAGRRVTNRHGTPRVTGGEPFLVWPTGSRERAVALVQEFEQLQTQHTRTRRGRDAGSNLAILMHGLAAATREQAGARERGRVRLALALIADKRGRPDEARHQRLRQQQAAVAGAPQHTQLALLLAQRLRAQIAAGADPELGVHDPEALLQPTGAGESPTVPAAVAFPPALQRRVRALQEASLEALLAAGLVPSAEVLAELAPELAARAVAQATVDPVLQRVVAATYLAFRRRRSLLLLDLQHQVRFEELPWIGAIAEHCRDGGGAAAAQRAFDAVLVATLQTFPGTLVPNALLTELGALARAAGHELPLVEELAADIFQGTFTGKFAAAAATAATLLQGSAYQDYYDIDWAEVLALPKPAAQGAHAAFAALCRRRAGPLPGRGVVDHGMVIEQQQILTTQNLAVLLSACSHRQQLVDRSPELVAGCTRHLIGLVRQIPGERRARLRLAKDLAYGCRQLLFFASLRPRSEFATHCDEVRAAIAAVPPAARALLQPVLAGLEWIAAGNRFAAPPTAGAPRRLLGWSDGPHWLFGGS